MWDDNRWWTKKAEQTQMETSLLLISSQEKDTGVVTRITAALFIIEMIGATLIVKISKGFVGGYELELLLMAVCISLLLTGPGRISIERDILKREIFPRGKAIVQSQKMQ